MVMSAGEGASSRTTRWTLVYVPQPVAEPWRSLLFLGQERCIKESGAHDE